MCVGEIRRGLIPNPPILGHGPIVSLAATFLGTQVLGVLSTWFCVALDHHKGPFKYYAIKGGGGVKLEFSSFQK